MSRLFFGVALMALIAGSASAECVGTDQFRTCYDNSGNNYTVTEFGDTTVMHGHNYRTGSSWSQQSTTSGGVTFDSGRDSDGDYWSNTRVNPLGGGGLGSLGYSQQ